MAALHFARHEGTAKSVEAGHPAEKAADTAEEGAAVKGMRGGAADCRSLHGHGLVWRERGLGMRAVGFVGAGGSRRNVTADPIALRSFAWQFFLARKIRISIQGGAR